MAHLDPMAEGGWGVPQAGGGGKNRAREVCSPPPPSPTCSFGVFWNFLFHIRWLMEIFPYFLGYDPDFWDELHKGNMASGVSIRFSGN